MKCQSLFSGKSKQNITNVSSVELAHSVLNLILVILTFRKSLL